MFGSQRARHFDWGQDTTPFVQWIVTVLLVCQCMLCVTFYFSVAYTSETIKNYARKIDKEIDLLKLEDDLKLEYIGRLISQQERSLLRQSTLVHNIMFQVEVAYADLDMIDQTSETMLHNRPLGERILTDFNRNDLSYEKESARRKVENIVRELWNFINDQLRNLQESLQFDEELLHSADSKPNAKSTNITKLSKLLFKSETGPGKDENIKNKKAKMVSLQSNILPEIITPAVQTEGGGSNDLNNERKMHNGYSRDDTTESATTYTSTNLTLKKKLQMFKEELGDYRRALLDAFGLLKNAGQAENIRRTMSKKFGNLVQQRLQKLQNPASCQSSNIIGCTLKVCGFGCNFHHFIYCLITAYATNKTLVILGNNAWHTLFEPITKSCSDLESSLDMKNDMGGVKNVPENEFKISENNAFEKGKPVPEFIKIILPSIDDYFISETRQFLPLNVPEDLVKELSKFHGNPAVWWIGQIASYLFKPSPILTKHLRTMERTLDYQKPIVGVHVRRTDKVTAEADFHKLDEYMVHVEDYFQQLERSMPQVVRRVFLATDDSDLLGEAKMKYPKYIFVSDNNASRVQIDDRLNVDPVKGVSADIYFLSRSDYLVCTFSSQVCRLAFELMQTFHGDASQNFRSLDDIYYFGGQEDHVMTAIEPYTSDAKRPDTIDLAVGDSILVAGNHWNGFSKGFNKRSNRFGLYPSYKVEDTISSFPVKVYDLFNNMQ